MKAISMTSDTDGQLFVLCNDGSVYFGTWSKREINWSRLTDGPWVSGERPDTADVKDIGVVAKG